MSLLIRHVSNTGEAYFNQRTNILEFSNEKNINYEQGRCPEVCERIIVLRREASAWDQQLLQF